MNRCSFAAVAVAVVSTALFPGPSWGQPATNSPHRQIAASELREAKRELESVREDRSGRVKEAIKAIDRAVWAIDYVLTKVGETPGVVALDPGRYPEFKDHVQLRRADYDLQAARDEMTSAQGDQWGLRKSALQDIQTAIDAVKDLLPVGK
jgi:hypothetical protein